MVTIFGRSAWLILVFTASILAPCAAEAVCVYPVSTLACLDEVDSTPLGTKTPLILIHGWNQHGIPGDMPTDTWNNLVAYFSDIRNAELSVTFKLYEFRYYSNLVDVVTLATALRDLIGEKSNTDSVFGSRRIVLIAHSMGGLIGRYFLTVPQSGGSFRGEPGGERVALLITLGTPHHGAPLANGDAVTAKLEGALRQLWLRVTDFYFLLGDPQWWEVNRSDLRWDNFDGVLDYDTYANERNLFLETLNADSRYDSKVIAYGGALGACSVVLHPITCGVSTIVANVFGVASDGFVPISSALGYTVVTGEPRFRTWYFSDHDHEQMRTGKSDGTLFAQLKVDLLSIAPQGAPGPPRDLTYNMSSSTLSLFWKLPASGGTVTSYQIEAGSSPGRTDRGDFSTGDTNTAYSTTNVPAGDYFVRVRAVNEFWKSGPSNEVSIHVGAGCSSPPGAPGGLFYSIASSTVTFGWSASSGSVTSYVLEAGSTPGSSNLASLDTNSASLSYTASGVGNGTYYVRVRGRNTCGLSGPSNEVVVQVGSPTPTPTPTPPPTPSPPMDNYVDLGNPDDEPFHNLRGWGSVNPGLLPAGIDTDRTSRYQTLRGDNSVDLSVTWSSQGQRLTFRTERGFCDDSFDVYVNGEGPLYSFQASSTNQQFPLHRVDVGASIISGDTATVTFRNRAQDSCGRAAVYFVRIDPFPIASLSVLVGPAPVSPTIGCLAQVWPIWTYPIMVSENRGVGFTVNRITWNTFDDGGASVHSTSATGSDFAFWFHYCGPGSSRIQPFGRACVPNYCTDLGGRGSGFVEVVISGFDDAGNSGTFLSNRLQLLPSP